ncbi:MAG: hypothetical protein HY886_06085 [Deltaproteobacteria bacterium]|nr:hypothetical protein [Deltaproteobacteria bacterium]
MNMEQHRRRRFLIKPSYQMEAAVKAFGFVILYSIALGAIIFYPLYRDLYYSTGLQEQAIAAHTVLYLHSRIWISIIIVAILTAVYMIFVTHRIAGPIYRFEKTAEEFMAGRFGQHIRLRRRDNLVEIEGIFNRLSDFLHEARSGDNALHASLNATLEQIRRLIEEGKKDEALEAIKTLMSRLSASPDAFSGGINRK